MVSRLRALRTEALERNLLSVQDGAFGKLPNPPFRFRDRQINVDHAATRLTMKVGVIADIRAKAAGRPVQVDLSHQPALGKGLQTVVDRSQGNTGHAIFDPHEDLHGGGVIALVEKSLVDLPALFGEPKISGRHTTTQNFLFRKMLFAFSH